MWLDRLREGQSSPTASPNRAVSHSPAPRRSIQLGPSTLPRRPGLSPRTSSLSAASQYGFTESASPAARIPNGNTLKQELAGSLAAGVSDPLDVLTDILGPLRKHDERVIKAEDTQPDILIDDIDFNGLSLEDFANAAHAEHREIEPHAASQNPSISDFEVEKDKFADLHQSILACDQVLQSVEAYLTSFQADLAAVSSEIEHLQHRSTALNTKLQTRQAVEKVLGPQVEAFILPPAVVRKLTEGVVDEAWVHALEELEKRSQAIKAKQRSGADVKAAQDILPFLEDVAAKAVERNRDYVVAQIKALRSPNINAQVIQQNNLLRYKGVFAFLATRQPQLAEEIAQAYVHTMRWYYLSHFTRYKTALEKLSLYSIDASDTLAHETSSTRKTGANSTHDLFSLGRRADILRPGVNADTALPAFTAEEDKSPHHLETPFRAFNLALIDNASAEYSFLSSFFSQNHQTTTRHFLSISTPTFSLGHSLTKNLIDSSLDALGVLLCVRQTQHLAFLLQRRRIPAVDGYVNGTLMLLWPRFQQIMDAHTQSLHRFTASLPSKPAGTALNLTSTSSSASLAPHPLTQKFARLTQGILQLSSEAGDDEPVASSLGRLKAEYEAFVATLGKAFREKRERERCLYNNFELVCTILGDVEGKLAGEVREGFEGLREGVAGD